MSTFDGSASASTGTLPGQSDDPEPVTPEPAFDALAALREQMRAREEEDTSIRVEIPGLGLRLVCDTDFSYEQFARWQKASLPPGQRNRRRGPNPIDLNQATLSMLVLLHTCESLEYRTPDGEWVLMLDSHSQPMKPDSDDILRRFEEVDPRSFLRRLFGGEAAVTRAGQRVIEAAGWVEEDGAEDPTA